MSFTNLFKNFIRIYGALSCVPSYFRKNRISSPKLVSHSKWADFLSNKFNHSGMRILEIGSRNVTGANLRNRFSNAEYVGFDFLDGENVDVVGDCHKLTDYFDVNERFDLIFSSAVFEHLYMPWVAAEEITKMLKVGGYLFVETHFSFSSHERPWNFFQFSDMGLRALFNEGMGFRLLDKGLSNPIFGYFDRDADRYLRYLPVAELYCHSEILCEKVAEVRDFQWRNLSIDNLVEGTRYPPSIGRQRV